MSLENVFLTSTPEPSVLSWCFTCTAPDAQLQCTRCHVRKYCNKYCQMRHWKEHKIECTTHIPTRAAQWLVEPTLELLKEEQPAAVSMRYAAAKHELALNKKLVFIFYATDTAFAQYLFSRTEIDEPEEVQHRLLVVTLAEFRTFYVFSLHRHVRRIVEAIHACKVKESAWVSVTCLNPEFFEVTVRGGLYAPEVTPGDLHVPPSAAVPLAPVPAAAEEEEEADEKKEAHVQ